MAILGHFGLFLGAGGEVVIVLVAMHQMVMMVPIALAVVINVVMVAIAVMDVARTGGLDIVGPLSGRTARERNANVCAIFGRGIPRRAKKKPRTWD